jgi:hypothetical protein
VNTVKSLRFKKKSGKILIIWGAVSLWIKTLLSGIQTVTLNVRNLCCFSPYTGWITCMWVRDLRYRTSLQAAPLRARKLRCAMKYAPRPLKTAIKEQIYALRKRKEEERF